MRGEATTKNIKNKEGSVGLIIMNIGIFYAIILLPRQDSRFIVNCKLKLKLIGALGTRSLRGVTSHSSSHPPLVEPKHAHVHVHDIPYIAYACTLPAILPKK